MYNIVKCFAHEEVYRITLNKLVPIIITVSKTITIDEEVELSKTSSMHVRMTSMFVRTLASFQHYIRSSSRTSQLQLCVRERVFSCIFYII